MHTCACSRVKRKSFYRKSELQMFLLICGGRIGGQFLSTNMAPPKLYKGSSNISANNSETVATKAWDLDKLFVYYSFITFHFVVFFYWTVSNAINTAQKKYDARLRDSENKECVPVFSKKKKDTVLPYASFWFCIFSHLKTERGKQRRQQQHSWQQQPAEAVKKGGNRTKVARPPVTIQVLRKVSSLQKSNQIKPCIARLLIRMNIIHVGCSSISAVLLRRRLGEGKKSEGTLP